MNETIESIGDRKYQLRTHASGATERVLLSGLARASLAEAKSRATAGVYEQAKRRLDSVFDKRYSPGERYLWADLEREARSLAAGDTLPPDSVLAAEAAAVGRDLAEYAAGIVANADELRAYRTAVVAARAAHKAAIEGLETAEEVEAYDVTEGWP